MLLVSSSCTGYKCLYRELVCEECSYHLIADNKVKTAIVVVLGWGGVGKRGPSVYHYPPFIMHNVDSKDKKVCNTQGETSTHPRSVFVISGLKRCFLICSLMIIINEHASGYEQNS